MSRPRDYLQPRPRNRIPYLVVMRAAGDAILLAPDQQRRHRNLAELRAAVDARHDRALLRKEGVGAGIGGHRPRDAKQAGVAALFLGEEDRDALLDDLIEIAALDEVDIALAPCGLRGAVGRGEGCDERELRDALGCAAHHLVRDEADRKSTRLNSSH